MEYVDFELIPLPEADPARFEDILDELERRTQRSSDDAAWGPKGRLYMVAGYDDEGEAFAREFVPTLDDIADDWRDHIGLYKLP